MVDLRLVPSSSGGDLFSADTDEWLPLPRPAAYGCDVGRSSGTSLTALMASVGHSSAAAALRYQHVTDGQGADIVRYLERFGEKPAMPFDDRGDAAATANSG